MAAGGIADGRGLAAALVLGAQAANIGSRFLASAAATEQPTTLIRSATNPCWVVCPNPHSRLMCGV